MRGRPGKRSREQRIRELLKKASSWSIEKYHWGGRQKAGGKAPRPITLPKIGVRSDTAS